MPRQLPHSEIDQHSQLCDYVGSPNLEVSERAKWLHGLREVTPAKAEISYKPSEKGARLIGICLLTKLSLGPPTFLLCSILSGFLCSILFPREGSEGKRDHGYDLLVVQATCFRSMELQL